MPDQSPTASKTIERPVGPTAAIPSSVRSAGAQRSDDLSASLHALRAYAGSVDDNGHVNRLVADVFRAAKRLKAEHAGMAKELLCLYEQIGIVFEVTRRLPKLSEESAVIDFFVDNLRCSFQRHDVFFISPRAARTSEAVTDMHGVPPHGTEESSSEASGWLGGLVEQSRQEGAVLVADVPVDVAPASFREIMVGPVQAGERSNRDAFIGAIVVTRHDLADPFRASDMRLVEALTTFCGDLIRNHRLAEEIRGMSVATVQSLVNAVDQKDPYTCGHSVRVGYYACLLGRQLRLSAADLQMLRWSALLHDVGKIGIRDDVLKKDGRLTDEELDHVREHPSRSYQVVREVPQLADALDGVLYHHERFDGSGYPSGLAGEKIPLQARIIQIADVFDALTSNRSYRPAYSWSEALAIMNKEAGRTIDPSLAATFNELIRNEIASADGGWEELFSKACRSRLLDDYTVRRISEA